MRTAHIFSSFITLCLCPYYVFVIKMSWTLHHTVSPAHIFKNFCLGYADLWLRFGKVWWPRIKVHVSMGNTAVRALYKAASECLADTGGCFLPHWVVRWQTHSSPLGDRRTRFQREIGLHMIMLQPWEDSTGEYQNCWWEIKQVGEIFFSALVV